MENTINFGFNSPTLADKANILPIAENFKMIDKNRFDKFYQIGDVITTARSAVLSNWLRCDGSVVMPGDYPSLESMLESASFSGKWATKNLQFGNILGMANNASWIVVHTTTGLYTSNTGFSSGLVRNTSVPATGIGNSAGTTIKYLNGYWVLVDMHYIYYCKGNPNGTWGRAGSFGGDPWNISSIEWGNDYWVITHGHSSAATMWYKQGDFATGTWQSYTMTGFAGPQNLTYANNYWAFTYASQITPSEQNIYYRTGTPNGTFSEGALRVPNSGKLKYTNGYWFYLENATPGNGRLYYGTSALNLGNVITFPVSLNALDVCYANNTWAVFFGTSGGLGALFYKQGAFSNDTNNWTKNANFTAKLENVFFYSNVWYGRTWFHHVSVAEELIYMSNGLWLPDISLGTGARSYIKAKELP